MGKSLLILLTVVCMTPADGITHLGPVHPSGTGPVRLSGIAYSQTFVPQNVLDCYSNYSGEDRWITDDFTLDDDIEISEIVIWMIYLGSPSTQVNLAIAEDNGDSSPASAVTIWSAAAPCINYATGYTLSGYDICRTSCSIPPDLNPELSANIHYWLEVQAVNNVNALMLVQNHSLLQTVYWKNGSSGWESTYDAFGEFTDAFFDIYATDAFDRNSWGAIKTLFQMEG